MNFAILFSGQGLQHEQHVDELLSYAQVLKIEDKLYAMMPELFTAERTQIDLYHNDFAQPFIFALQWCRWKILADQLSDINVFSGYSLGELTALICSSELDFSTGLMLAKQRARLMSNAVATISSGLASIKGLNVEKLMSMLSTTNTEISIKLNDSSFIVGGFNQNLDNLMTSVVQAGGQFKRLNVTIPSHTSMMQRAVAPYHHYLNQQAFGRLLVPIVSGSGGKKSYQSHQAIQSLIYQMDHPIDWDLCLESIKENMPDVIFEIGPGNALSKMLVEIQPNLATRSFDDFKSMAGVQHWLQRFE